MLAAVQPFCLKTTRLAKVKPCKHCGTRLFDEEDRNICCVGGKILVPPLTELPPDIKTLYTNPDVKKCQRQLNALFSFVAMASKHTAERMWEPLGFGCVTLNGSVYFRMFDSYADYDTHTRNSARLYYTPGMGLAESMIEAIKPTVKQSEQIVEHAESDTAAMAAPTVEHPESDAAAVAAVAPAAIPASGSNANKILRLGNTVPDSSGGD